jgi:hypothetical protein
MPSPKQITERIAAKAPAKYRKNAGIYTEKEPECSRLF